MARCSNIVTFKCTPCLSIVAHIDCHVCQSPVTCHLLWINFIIAYCSRYFLVIAPIRGLQLTPLQLASLLYRRPVYNQFPINTNTQPNTAILKINSISSILFLKKIALHFNMHCYSNLTSSSIQRQHTKKLTFTKMSAFRSYQAVPYYGINSPI